MHLRTRFSRRHEQYETLSDLERAQVHPILREIYIRQAESHSGLSDPSIIRDGIKDSEVRVFIHALRIGVANDSVPLETISDALESKDPRIVLSIAFTAITSGLATKEQVKKLLGRRQAISLEAKKALLGFYAWSAVVDPAYRYDNDTFMDDVAHGRVPSNEVAGVIFTRNQARPAGILRRAARVFLGINDEDFSHGADGLLEFYASHTFSGMKGPEDVLRD